LYFNSPIHAAGPLLSYQQDGASCYKNLVIDREKLLVEKFHSNPPAEASEVEAAAATTPVEYEPEEITVTPCSDGAHDCDTSSTFCAATTDHDSGFFCLCLEGFERLEGGGHTECTTAGEASEAPTGEGEDTTVPVIVPTNPCINGSHGCDTTSTHCVETHWHNSGYLCLCLPGFYRTKDSDGGWRAKAAEGTEDHSTCWPKAADAR
jgi:hypothetical protein